MLVTWFPREAFWVGHMMWGLVQTDQALVVALIGYIPPELTDNMLNVKQTNISCKHQA